MGIERKAFLVCNRCGGRVEVDDEFSLYDVAEKRPGWVRLADKALCPECAPRYEVMRARHRAEVDDYVGGR